MSIDYGEGLVVVDEVLSTIAALVGNLFATSS